MMAITLAGLTVVSDHAPPVRTMNRSLSGNQAGRFRQPDDHRSRINQIVRFREMKPGQLLPWMVLDAG